MKATIQKGVIVVGRWIRSRPAVLAFLAGFGAALGGWLGYILWDISRRIDWYQVMITIVVLVFFGGDIRLFSHTVRGKTQEVGHDIR